MACAEHPIRPPGEEGPVTVSVARKITPGREADYEAWIMQIARDAARFPGHQGVNVLRPCAATSHDYILIYRFDSYEHANTWEHSDVRRARIAELEGIVEGEPVMRRGTGLEFWFDLPEIPMNRPAPRYKMVIVLTSALYLLSVLFVWFVDPWLSSWPEYAALFVAVLLKVLLMSYLLMPNLTKLLHGWLYRDV